MKKGIEQTKVRGDMRYSWKDGYLIFLKKNILNQAKIKSTKLSVLFLSSEQNGNCTAGGSDVSISQPGEGTISC